MSTKLHDLDELGPDWEEDTIYCEAESDPHDVIYEGSDDEQYASAQTRKKRYVAAGYRYLQGRGPTLLSASLHGPFNASSGWKNPWAPRTVQRSSSSNIQSTSSHRSRASLSQSGSSKAAGRKQQRLEQSQESHLPSPESLKHASAASTPDKYLDEGYLASVRRWTESLADNEAEHRSTAASVGSSVSRKPQRTRSEWIRKLAIKRQQDREAPCAAPESDVHTGVGFSFSQPPRRGCRAAFDDPLKISFSSAPGKMQTTEDDVRPDGLQQPFDTRRDANAVQNKDVVTARPTQLKRRLAETDSDDELSQKNTPDALTQTSRVSHCQEQDGSPSAKLSKRRRSGRSTQALDRMPSCSTLEKESSSKIWERKACPGSERPYPTSFAQQHDAAYAWLAKNPNSTSEKREESRAEPVRSYADEAATAEDVPLKAEMDTEKPVVLLAPSFMSIDPTLPSGEEVRSINSPEAKALDQSSQHRGPHEYGEIDEDFSNAALDQSLCDTQLMVPRLAKPVDPESTIGLDFAASRSEAMEDAKATAGPRRPSQHSTGQAEEEEHGEIVVSSAYSGLTEDVPHFSFTSLVSRLVPVDSWTGRSSHGRLEQASRDSISVRKNDLMSADATCSSEEFSNNTADQKEMSTHANKAEVTRASQADTTAPEARTAAVNDQGMVVIPGHTIETDSMQRPSLVVKRGSSPVKADDSPRCDRDSMAIRDEVHAVQSHEEARDQDASMTSARDSDLPPDSTQDPDVSMASVQTSDTTESTACPNIGSAQHAEPGTLEAVETERQGTPVPSLTAIRSSTPEPRFAIKSMASFMSPSPQRKRRCRPTRISSCTSVARSSTKSALKSRWSVSRTSRRVTWAPLPSDDTTSGMARLRQASPPPENSVDLSSKEDDKFQQHFTAMTRRKDAKASEERQLSSQAQQLSHTSAVRAAADVAEELVEVNTTSDAPVTTSYFSGIAAHEDVDMDREDSEEPMDHDDDVFKEMDELLEAWDADIDLGIAA